MRVDCGNDEIKAHVAGRYLSPPEAAWHIYQFRSHEEFPPVTRLALHLPDEQPVYFDEDASREEIRETMEKTASTLMAFFDYNARHPNGPKYRYPEFPEHFMYDQPTRSWHRRGGSRRSAACSRRAPPRGSV